MPNNLKSLNSKPIIVPSNIIEISRVHKLNRRKAYFETCKFMEIFNVDQKFFINLYNEVWNYKIGKVKDISFMEHVENTVIKLEHLDKIL